jgi:hypothetical protein
MLRPIKNEHLSRDSFCCEQIRVLRHISRTVDFSFVVEFLDDLDAGLRRDGVSTEFTTLFIVVVAVKFFVAFGDLDTCDLEVVLGLARGVGSKEEAVGCVGLVCRSLC